MLRNIWLSNCNKLCSLTSFLTFLNSPFQHIARPHTLIEEDPQYRRVGAVIRVEKMFEQIMSKLPGPPQFLLCVLPERKSSDIYGIETLHLYFILWLTVYLVLKLGALHYIKALGRKRI